MGILTRSCSLDLVILCILQPSNNGLGRKPVANGIAARTSFAFRRCQPVLLSALRRLAAICLSELINNSAPKLASSCELRTFGNIECGKGSVDLRNDRITYVLTITTANLLVVKG